MDILPLLVFSQTITQSSATHKMQIMRSLCQVFLLQSLFLPIITWLISVRFASLAGYQITVISGLGDHHLVNIKNRYVRAGGFLAGCTSNTACMHEHGIS